MTAPLPETLLAEIIGISADAIICVDGDQRITFFNEGACRIFGYAAAEVLGQPLDILLPTAVRNAHRAHIERFASSAISARRMGERQEISGRRKSGEEFPAEAAIAHLSVEGRRYASVVLRDITSRKRAERRQRVLVEASEQLAGTLDLDQTLALVVRMWLPLFGTCAVLEMPWNDGLHHVRAATGGDGVVSVTPPVRTAGARMLPVAGLEACSESPVSSTLATAVVDALPPEHRASARACDAQSALVVSLSQRGTMLGRVVVLAAHDIELDAGDRDLAADLARRASLALENARLHAQLRKALRARDDTMGVVSHDLRNPVSVVKMLTAAILQGDQAAALPAGVTEHVTVIRSAAEQMDSLIQDLLDMNRAEAGRFDVHRRIVSASSLLREALRTLVPLAADRKITIRTGWADPLPDIHVEPERIAQVLSNLVGNAIKFTPDGGRISVTAEAGATELLVSVSDSGPGIAAENLSHVFDRYWQSDRRNHGVGLGLPIAKAIIEAHHGRIWAERVEGRGAVFHFTLPL